MNEEQYVVVEYTVYSGYEEGIEISLEFNSKEEALNWLHSQSFPQDGKAREVELAYPF